VSPSMESEFMVTKQMLMVAIGGLAVLGMVVPAVAETRVGIRDG